MKEVRNYEPSNALFADEKGLYFYRKIIENLSKHLKRKQFLFLEVGINQPDGVVKILKNNNFNVVSIKKDISNIPRCIICLLYTSPSPRDRTRSRMPSSA